MKKSNEYENMSAIEILNLYRNKYYAEPTNTEKGIVANAINEILPKINKVHPESV